MNNKDKKKFIGGDSMHKDEELIIKQAKNRLSIKKSFRIHRNTYILMMIFLFIMNIWTSPQNLWIKWCALPWGIALGFHYFISLKMLRYGNGDERMLEKEIEYLKKTKENQ